MDPLSDLADRMQGLSLEVTDLRQAITQLQALGPALPHGVCCEPKVSLPETFSGGSESFVRFREACKLHFCLCPHSSGDEEQRVRIVISLLRGNAQTWAFSLPSGDPSLRSVVGFFAALGQIYDDPDRVALAESNLRLLCQNKLSAELYCSEFRRWAADSGWNDAALRSQFCHGLSEKLKDAFAFHERPTSLDSAMSLAVRLDRRLRERKETSLSSHCQCRGSGADSFSVQGPHPVPLPSEEEPMQLGRLTSDKGGFTPQTMVCFCCGGIGHLANVCPSRKFRNCTKTDNKRKTSKCKSSNSATLGKVGVEIDAFPLTCSSRFLLSARVALESKVISCEIFVDSGAAVNLIDSQFVAMHGFQVCTLEKDIPVFAIDSAPLSQRSLKGIVHNIRLAVGDAHVEDISCFVLNGLPSPLVLGLPWLTRHNPTIDWQGRQINEWSEFCRENCLSATFAEVSIKTVPSFLSEFSDVFSESGVQELPPHREYDCPINLIPGAKLPKARLYNLSQPERVAMRTYISESLDKGHIRPSKSPVAAGFFFVKKKDGSLRPCLDFRELNRITIRDPYPLPLIPDLFNQIVGAKVFSKLDLRGAYNLVRVREGDEWKTAFNTPNGHFENLVMPFGLMNAPAVFQHFVNSIFYHLMGKFVLVYLDDILIFSPDVQTHQDHLFQVLRILRENKLYAKLEKCVFMVSEIQFLGFLLSASGFRMDPEKVRAVLEWDLPENQKALMRFLGFANYYRKFILNYSSVVKPLTDMTKKGVDFSSWSEEALAAFSEIKESFASAPILVHPDVSLPFIVEVDASEVGVGAVLSQGPSPAKWRPCAFFSKKLSPAERNYDVGDRELLAIKLAFEEWRHWLEGARHPITVFTDHKNLAYLESAKRMNPRQARWSLFFSRFNFVVTFRPGIKNVKADALSRCFPGGGNSEDPGPILAEGVVVSALYSDLEAEVQAAQAEAPVRCPSGKLFVPPELRHKLFKEHHDTVLAGHPGSRATIDLIARRFWWPALRKSVEGFVAACETCARAKVPRSPPSGPLLPLPIPSRPWTHLSMDFITDLPRSSGKSVILVVVDRFSKMVHFIPFPGLPNAKTLAQAFVDHIVKLHGIPSDIVSDRGTQFVSRFWKAFCSRLGIRLSFSSAFHPQSNGQTERVNQNLETYLRCFVAENQEDWCSFLPLAEFALNNRRQESSDKSPFFGAYGFHPQFGTFSGGGTSGLPEEERFSSSLSTIWQKIQSNLRKMSEKYKRVADKRRVPGPDLNVGDLVWLSTRNIKLKVPSWKLGPKFIGPYKISSIVNPVAFRLDLPRVWKIHNVFHRSLLKPYVQPTVPSSLPPPPILIDGNLEFEVSRIVNSRLVRGSLQYLVHWKGYGPEERMWVPVSDIKATRLIRAFYRAHPEKVGPGCPESTRRGGGTVTTRSSHSSVSPPL